MGNLKQNIKTAKYMLLAVSFLSAFYMLVAFYMFLFSGDFKDGLIYLLFSAVFMLSAIIIRMEINLIIRGKLDKDL